MLTTPESPVFYRWLKASRDAGDVAVALEVSSHSLMLARVHGARFRVGLFTNLTQDHLDFHEDHGSVLPGQGAPVPGERARPGERATTRTAGASSKAAGCAPTAWRTPPTTASPSWP